MRYLTTVVVLIIGFQIEVGFAASGHSVTYDVNGQAYEGYYVSPDASAPLVLLIHDWDGLTNYEIERAKMLGKLGYSVFVADLFGKGIRPTEVKDKKQHQCEVDADPGCQQQQGERDDGQADHR